MVKPISRSARLRMVWGFGTFLVACTPQAVPADPLPKGVAPHPCPHGCVDAQLQLGEAVYARLCRSCHADGGLGTPGIFPPLVGHAPRLAQTQAGQNYLVALVLWGVSGPIAVEGRRFDNVMPAQGPLLRDDEVAAALAYVTHAWGNCRYVPATTHFTAEMVAQARQPARAAAQVFQLRQNTAFGAPAASVPNTRPTLPQE